MGLIIFCFVLPDARIQISGFREKPTKKVVKYCFSYDLHEDYKGAIYDFRNSFNDLGIAVTPKVHAVFYHIIEFCDKRGTGLGTFSEQASESVHRLFKKTWEKYKVSEENDKYGDNLFKAVTDFNSLNM